LQLIGKSATFLACAAALCLAACGGGGSGGGGEPPATPYPTQGIDELPSGPRIDVSGQDLFHMGQNDSWFYTVLDAGGQPTGNTASRQVIQGPFSNGQVSIVDDDGFSSTTTYIVSADGLLDTDPLSGPPPGVKALVGGIFEYATPLYPASATRRHVRSGPWDQDLDGDGINESFRYEYTQVFVGFETLTFSGNFTLKGVAHFVDVFKFTLRYSHAANGETSLTSTESNWFAPGAGLVKSQRTTVDGDGNVVEAPHTLVFDHGTISGVTWNIQSIPPILDGSFFDVSVKHNALVYDAGRNVYYASVPGSYPVNPNSIATIDPTTGQVSFSGVVGSEPNPLALASDGSALYVGADGTGDVVKLALPSMSETARTKLPTDVFLNQLHAQAIAASPADPDVIAVAMLNNGVALLRGMVVQPNRTPTTSRNDLLVFDSTGGKLYGLNTQDSGAGLSRNNVLTDGLAEETVAPGPALAFSSRALSFSNNRVVAGRNLYNAPSLERAGIVATVGECTPQRSGTQLLCFDTNESNTGYAHIVFVDRNTFVLGGSMFYALNEPGVARRLVEGPAGQVAISYPANSLGFTSKVRLFTSPLLLTPPPLPAASFPVTASSTADGTALDIALTRNDVVYDSTRNLYYASVPGSVVGAGNSIASIDPATGAVTTSAPIGSEPTLLALAQDGSVLYVGLNGSGDLVKLALPGMTELGRVHVATTGLGQRVVSGIAISPADASVVAISFGTSAVAGGPVALVKGMTIQPQTSSATESGNNLLVFDAAGATLYGLNTWDTGADLRRFQVLADGVSEQQAVQFQGNNFVVRNLGFANSRIISPTLYDAPALTVAGSVSGAADCVLQRAGAQLLCLNTQDPLTLQSRILIADSSSFTVGASLLYNANEPFDPTAVRKIVQGPAGQVAIHFQDFALRLFSSAQLP
jgi:hypothetical protein